MDTIKALFNLFLELVCFLLLVGCKIIHVLAVFLFYFVLGFVGGSMILGAFRR